MNKRIIIGITGALATGKTTVADMFVLKGAVKIDADKIGHRLLREDSEIQGKIIDIFGEDILGKGEIDRRKLAEKVFPDKRKLDSLNRILHPVIIRRIKEQAEKISDAVIVIDAPLLIETGLHEYVDKVMVVTSEYGTQIKRAMDRGISEQEAKDVIGSQMSLPEKIKFADYIIDNNGSLNEAKEGVEKIWNEI